MIISEIYPCLQGEGKYMGMPSILIRTSTCNLRCEWTLPDGSKSKCDTPWTSWNPETNQMSVQEVAEKVRELARERKTPHVIISGGEPLLQAEDVRKLYDELVLKGTMTHMTVETNGTRHFRDEKLLDRRRLTLSISPKMSNSIPIGSEHEERHRRDAINLSVLRDLVHNFDSYLKFVVCSENDMQGILALTSDLNVSREDVYLMPEGQDPESLAKKRLWLVEYCRDNGYRYTDRLHVIVYGKKRGV